MPDLPEFSGPDSVAPELRRMVAACSGREPRQMLLETANLYARQFLGMSGGYCVALAQSVYTSPRHMTCQQSFFDAREAYRREQLELAEQEDLPDDHLAVILAFMGRKAASLSGVSGERERREALREQALLRQRLLLNWTDALAQRAEDLQPDSLYTKFLLYLREFLEYDRTAGELLLAEEAGRDPAPDAGTALY